MNRSLHDIETAVEPIGYFLSPTTRQNVTKCLGLANFNSFGDYEQNFGQWVIKIYQLKQASAEKA